MKGFYLAADFKRRKASFIFLSQKQKPFEFDYWEGFVKAKAIPIFDRNSRNMFASDWFWFEGNSINDLNSDTSLRDFVNEVWKTWCIKHHRKYERILGEIKNEEF
jgi:hypothetical protein